MDGPKISAFIVFQRVTTCRRFSIHDRARIFIETGGGKTLPLGAKENSGVRVSIDTEKLVSLYSSRTSHRTWTLLIHPYFTTRRHLLAPEGFSTVIPIELLAYPSILTHTHTHIHTYRLDLPFTVFDRIC